MTAPKRRTSEVEDLDDDEREAAATEAREAGLRAYRHWCDRGEPPSLNPQIAMRQACPYREESLRESFQEGWKRASGTWFDFVWVGTKYPERKMQRCRVVARRRSNVDVEFPDGERVSTRALWIRKVA